MPDLFFIDEGSDKEGPGEFPGLDSLPGFDVLVAPVARRWMLLALV
jgi:hypothetical protein